jgi:hypothetical protein
VYTTLKGIRINVPESDILTLLNTYFPDLIAYTEMYKHVRQNRFQPQDPPGGQPFKFNFDTVQVEDDKAIITKFRQQWPL